MKENQPKTTDNPSKAFAYNLSKGKGISVFSPVQSKLTIGAVNDPLEQEADAMADKVIGMTELSTQQQTLFAPPATYTNLSTSGTQQEELQRKEDMEELIEEPLPVFKHERAFDVQPMPPPPNDNNNKSSNNFLQRKCTHCEEEEKAQLVNRKESNTNVPNVNSNLESYVSSLGNYGSPLSAETKSYFEAKFGYDFSDVKTHTDTAAAKSADSINALAYTSGNNIVFNEGQYAPDTDRGKRLMAHELTHVVQQGASVQALKADSNFKSETIDYPNSKNEAGSMYSNTIKDNSVQPIMSDNETVIRRDGPAAAPAPAAPATAGPAPAPAAPQPGSEQQPYVSLAEQVTHYTISIVDDDLTGVDNLASFTLAVTWNKIAWKGRTVWIPHDIRADSGHGRSIRTGQTVFANFSSTGDDLIINVFWNCTLVTSDINVTTERSIDGHLDSTHENSLSLSATVPVEGVPVAGQAGSRTSSQAGVRFTERYGESFVDGGSRATIELLLRSSTSGVTRESMTTNSLEVFGSDRLLKDTYGSWLEGDLDIETRENLGGILALAMLRTE